MRCKFSERDLNQRLNGTICRYQGHPYMIGTAGGMELELRSLAGQKLVRNINADDPDFDISSVPLGFFQQTEKTVCYVTRKPARVWKQGVSPENVRYNHISNMGRNNHAASIFSKQFEESVLGHFPSIDEAFAMFERLEKLSDEECEVAISREVALRWNPKLRLVYVYYKTDQVGFIIFGTKTVIVPGNEFGWVVSHHLAGFNWKVE